MPYTNFSSLAPPLSVVVFLGAGLLTAALLSAAAVFALAGRPAPARRLLLGSGVLPSAYVAALVGLGAATRGQTVPRGGEKFFCEIDCHVGYSIAGFVEMADGGGRRAVVTLRSRFDETTISPRRGSGSLTPNQRSAALVDARGRRFVAEPAGVAALTAALKPGESYATDLVFRVPEGAGDLRLSLVEADGLVRLLLGHERAPFASETLLALR